MEQKRIRLDGATFGVDNSDVYIEQNGTKYYAKDWELQLIKREPDLLDEAEIGDICLHRDGRCSRITDIIKDQNNNNFYVCLFVALRWGYDVSIQSNGIYHRDNTTSVYDVVSFDKLADAGSWKWAVQMLRLGYKISSSLWEENVYYEFESYSGTIYLRLINDEIIHERTIDEFIKLYDTDFNEWKLYQPENATQSKKKFSFIKEDVVDVPDIQPQCCSSVILNWNSYPVIHDNLTKKYLIVLTEEQFERLLKAQEEEK